MVCYEQRSASKNEHICSTNGVEVQEHGNLFSWCVCLYLKWERRSYLKCRLRKIRIIFSCHYSWRSLICNWWRTIYPRIGRIPKCLRTAGTGRNSTIPRTNTPYSTHHQNRILWSALVRTQPFFVFSPLICFCNSCIQRGIHSSRCERGHGRAFPGSTTARILHHVEPLSACSQRSSRGKKRKNNR